MDKIKKIWHNTAYMHDRILSNTKSKKILSLPEMRTLMENVNSNEINEAHKEKFYMVSYAD